MGKQTCLAEALSKRGGRFFALAIAIFFLLALGACAAAPPSQDFAQEGGTVEKADCRTQYDFVSPFYKGRAVVKQDGKMFHIGLDCKPAYPERYDWAFHYSTKGRAWVGKYGKGFFIDLNGKRIEE